MAQTKTQFGYRRHPDQDRAGANLAEHAIVVVGAGYKNVVALTILLIVLLFFPHGLFGGLGKRV